MPKSGDNWRLVAFNAALACAAAVFFLVFGRDMVQHGRELFAHMGSGTWEIRTQQSSIEEFLSPRYPKRDWALHFPSGSGLVFPLSDEYRRESVQRLGHILLRDVPELSEDNSTTLYEAYREYLSDRVRNLGRRASAVDKSTLSNLLQLLDAKLGKITEPEDARIYDEASKVLRQMPENAILPKAISDFRDYSFGRGPGELRYEVYTDPSYDSIRDSQARAVAVPLAQESRCRGTAAPVFGAGDARATVTASTRPTIMVVTLIRRWMSDSLLDESSDLPAEIREKYFGDNGLLRLIPTHVVLHVWDHVEIEPAPGGPSADFDKIVMANACCRIECGEAFFDLAPETVGRAAMSYFGQTASRSPTVHAIVSKRRGL